MELAIGFLLGAGVIILAFFILAGRWKRQDIDDLEQHFAEMHGSSERTERRTIVADQLYEIMSDLEEQAAVIKERHAGEFPPIALDEWSIGYVAGYADAYLNRINPSAGKEQLQKITLLACSAAFGDEIGPSKFTSISSFVDRNDEAFFQGMHQGSEDLFASQFADETNRQFKLALGWVTHSAPIERT